MEMPEKLTILFWKINSQDPLAPPYAASWEMIFKGKRYGARYESTQMNQLIIKEALGLLGDEALLCLERLNLGRDE